MAKASNIEEFFGTLQNSVLETWREHLKTSKYSSHMALDEFYKDAPEKIDKLIEAYIGVNGKLNQLNKNIMTDPASLDGLDYLNELRDMLKDGHKFMNNETELESLLDDILSLVDSTIYKLRELHESLVDYIKRTLVDC